MEFLDISLQKTLVFCAMLFTVSSTGGFVRKPYSSVVLKILKKISERIKLETVHEQHFVER